MGLTDRPPDLRTISLGAGVQSTTLYLMACAGEIGPKPDAAIFADTQAEPPWVYEHLDRLERAHGAVLPIHRVTLGSLAEFALGDRRGTRIPRLPVFVRNADGSRGMMRRQCTAAFKIEPIKAKTRQILGLRKGQPMGKRRVEEWIGISTDEAHRMKPSRFPGFTSRWPLIEHGMSRQDCIRWLKAHGFEVPGKSACVFCPFHSDRTWAELQREHPDVFKQAAAFDDLIRSRGLYGVKGTPFLHRSLRPLRDVDFGADQLRLLDLDGWGNECEGRCGV